MLIVMLTVMVMVLVVVMVVVMVFSLDLCPSIIFLQSSGQPLVPA